MQNPIIDPALGSQGTDSQYTPIPKPKLDSNITQVIYVYLNNKLISMGGQDVQTGLDYAISKLSSQSSLETQSPKSNSLKNALEKIKEHNELLSRTKKETLISSNITKDIASLNKDIKETLGFYKDYFLIKFSQDGNPESCDQTIKAIVSNFDEDGELFKSFTNARETDKEGLKIIRFELNDYLVRLTMLAESKIKDSNDPNLDEDKQKKSTEEIKAVLLTFPGNPTIASQRDYNCVQGSRQRIQNAISALNESSPELKEIYHQIAIYSSRFASEVREGNQIHIPPCLIGALITDGEKVSQIDNYYTSPQPDMPLVEVMDFYHNLAKRVEDGVLKTKQELADSYGEFFRTNEVNSKTINAFVERYNLYGFKSISNLFQLLKPEYRDKSEDETSEFPEENQKDVDYENLSECLLLLADFKSQYLQIPTKKFQEELLKIQKELEPSESLPSIDYLKYFPDPRDLFKTHISNSPISPESTDNETLTNRLDFDKIKNLIALIAIKKDETTMGGSSSTSPEDEEITKKGKMVAGLIVLRAILDGFKTNDNPYFYFLKFDAKFQEKTQTSFQKFFYEERAGKLEVKAEFIEQKAILEKIESRRNYLERSFYVNLEEENYEKIKAFTQSLIAIEDFTQEENKTKFINLLTDDVVKIKNKSGENLINILYQFNEEAFKIALEKKPELINQITEKFRVDNGTSFATSSLIKKLAQQDFSQQNNKELLYYVLNKYKEKFTTEQDVTEKNALVTMIDQNNLLHHILSSNRDNADILDNIFKIVENDATINFNKQEQISGRTPLALASEKGHAKSVELLLKKPADPNISDLKKQTPLFIACQNGHTDIVKALIGVANPNISDLKKQTPLFIACLNGHTDIVKALIGAKANSNQAEKSFGATPLFIACQNGHTDIVKALIGAEDILLDKQFFNETTPLYIACQNGHTDIVKALIGAKADLNQAEKSFGATPLVVACYNGHTEIVKALIEKGADLNKPNKNGLTPLYIACQKGRFEIAQALFDGGADISIFQPTSLMEFCGGSAGNLKFDSSTATPEIKNLIKEITTPKAIAIRDQN